MRTLRHEKLISFAQAVDEPGVWMPELTQFETDYAQYELTSVHEFMKGFGRSWFLAGGTALDLYVGAFTRSHKDTDVAIEQAFAEEFHMYATSAGYAFFDHESTVLDKPEHLADGRENAFLHKIDFTVPGPEAFEIIFLQRDVDGNIPFYHDRRIKFPWRYYEEAPVRPIPGASSGLIIQLQPPVVILLHKLLDGRRQDIRDVSHTLELLNAEDHANIESSILKMRNLYIPRSGQGLLKNVLRAPLGLVGSERRQLTRLAFDSFMKDEPTLRQMLAAGDEAKMLDVDISAKMNHFYKAVKAENKHGTMRMYELELGKAAFGLVQGMSHEDYLNYELRRRLVRSANSKQVVIPFHA
ncbi:MAG: hypothetical protein JWP06_355 [Candidatus Saccharibacteria bacterium]|nr:hypothetical protein [Candidatus Saccharibacteria bacterium]